MFATPPGLLQGSLGPFGPESVSGSVRECPRKPGCLQECPTECLRGPLGPELRSVQKVSRECPRSVWDTFSTLQGHSRDTFWTLRRAGPKGPRRHSVGRSRRLPGFRGGDTLGTLPETLSRARETPVAGRGGRNPIFLGTL